jgi:hypothetical protein
LNLVFLVEWAGECWILASFANIFVDYWLFWHSWWLRWWAFGIN